MSEKIVFNGLEYDGVDAMPADVRRQYEDVLRMVREQGGAKVEPLFEGSFTNKFFKVTATVHRRIVVNGKEYHGVEEMPVEVRTTYERALAQGRGGTAPSLGTSAGSPGGAFRPPPLEEDRSGGRLLRIGIWLVIAGVLALWLFRTFLLRH